MRYVNWVKKAREVEAKKGVRLPRPALGVFMRRDRRMRESGLLLWERFWLVSHRLNTPGMRYLLRRRMEMYEEAKRRGITTPDWNRRIREWYRAEGWVFRDGTLDPFHMFEWFRDRKNLDVTPQPKKRIIRKDFVGYKRKTLGAKK